MPETQANHGGSLFNGDSHVLYWADVSAEIAFVVPTLGRKRKLNMFQQQHDPGELWWREFFIYLSFVQYESCCKHLPPLTPLSANRIFNWPFCNVTFEVVARNQCKRQRAEFSASGVGHQCFC